MLTCEILVQKFTQWLTTVWQENHFIRTSRIALKMHILNSHLLSSGFLESEPRTMDVSNRVLLKFGAHHKGVRNKNKTPASPYSGFLSCYWVICQSKQTHFCTTDHQWMHFNLMSFQKKKWFSWTSIWGCQ